MARYQALGSFDAIFRNLRTGEPILYTGDRARTNTDLFFSRQEKILILFREKPSRGNFRFRLLLHLLILIDPS